MSAPTDAFHPTFHQDPPTPALVVHTAHPYAPAYVRLRPSDIPPEIKRKAIYQALGGPPDDEGGYSAPRVVTIYYLANWRDLTTYANRFAISAEDNQPEFIVKEARPQWAVCARVYPVLRT